MNIKKKIIAIMVLMTFIPLVLLSVISINYLAKAIEEETIKQCREQTANVKLEVEAYLNRPLTAIKVVATAPAVRAFDLAQTKLILTQLQNTYPDLAFLLDDAKGNQVVRGDNLSLSNIADRGYYQAAMKGKEEAISEVIFAKNTNRFVVSMATPVREAETGTVIGVVQGSVALTKISEFVTKLSAHGAVAYVIDSNGKILAHPDEKLVKDRTDMSGKHFVKMALAERKSGFAIVDEPEAGKRILSYDVDERTGWLICMEVPYSMVTDKTRSLALVLGGITACVLGVLAFLVSVIARRVTQPIVDMQNIALQVSQGDLSRKMEITSNDEIGQLAKAFNLMVRNLETLVCQVQGAAEQVATAAEEMSNGAEQSALAANQVAVSITEVADGASKQLAVIDEAVVEIEAVTVNIHQVADQAYAVAEQSNRAADTAKAGGQTVSTAVDKMQDLAQAVGESAQIVTQLGQRSAEIRQIVDVISGIAGQTNLLALNAAIEAARAGEQGRGFAVVAEEVRKLAEQSQEAAKQIAGLLGAIQGDTDKAVVAMKQGAYEMQHGVEAVNTAGDNFQAIVVLVADLSAEVSKISESMKQMVRGSERICASMHEIDQLTKNAAAETQTVSAATEEQSASMEEIAAASQNLAKASQDLRAAVSEFRTRKCD